MLPFDDTGLPPLTSPPISDWNSNYRSCYTRILTAERSAIAAYISHRAATDRDAANRVESAKRNILCARVTARFLIELDAKRLVLGDTAAQSVVSQVTSPNQSQSPQEGIYGIGQLLRDRLIYACMC